MKFSKKVFSILLSCSIVSQSTSFAVSDNQVKNTSSCTSSILKKVSSRVAFGVLGTATIIGVSALTPYVVDKFDLDATVVGKCGFDLSQEDLKKYAKKEVVSTRGLLIELGSGYSEILSSRYVVKERCIKIRDGVTGIKKDTFKNCANLHKIVIPDSVNHIDDNALESDFRLGRLKIIYKGKKYDKVEEFMKYFKVLNENKVMFN